MLNPTTLVSKSKQWIPTFIQEQNTPENFALISSYGRTSPPPVKCQEEQVALIGTRRSQRSQRKIRPKNFPTPPKELKGSQRKNQILTPLEAETALRRRPKTDAHARQPKIHVCDRRPAEKLRRRPKIEPTPDDRRPSPRLRPHPRPRRTTEDRAHAYTHAGRPKIHN